jgi:hypothetical protein
MELLMILKKVLALKVRPEADAAKNRGQLE